VSDWWSPSFQTTIDAFYQGDFHLGRDACERVLSVAGVPARIEEQTRRNAVFYAPLLAETAPSATHVPIDIPVPDGWFRFNPSIAADPEGDGLHLIVRSSNYSMTRQLRYTIHDDSGVIRTTNYFLALSPDLAIRDVQPIDDAAFRIEPPPFPVTGFEDCRLIRHRGSWWVSATVRDRDANGVCRIALLRLEDATAVELHLLSDGLSRHEKNWMPAPDASQDVLRFVYSCHPTVITRYDDAAGSAVPEVIQPGPLVARRFSGGSQAVPFDGGWLCLVHEAANFDDGGRVYTHRWVWFDAEWRLSRLSLPFLLQERGIEFAGGLAHRGDDLVVSYGVWDRDAFLATVPIAEVLPLLAPPLDADAVEAVMRAAAPAVPAPAAATEEPVEKPAAPILDAEFAPIPAEPLTEGGSSHKTPVSALRAPLPSPWAGYPLGGGWGEGRPAPETSPGITPFAPNGVSIVSTTLTGNSEAIIGDALRSVVDWVDRLIVIDTGVTDTTLRIARDIAGEKLVLRQFPWRDDFAAARNFALAAAAELGADWAVTLDTDERLDLGDLDLRAALAQTDATALHVKHAGGTYGKERLFRLPARGAFVGPTHEAFIKSDGGGSVTLEGMHFDELGKSREQYRQKAERDIAILTRHTAERPDDPRWFYYLGDSLAGLGRHDEAIAAFRTCASLNGWDEEGAWAMYRAAESLLKLDRPVEAVEACAIGMAKHAGLAELPWLAAYASWHAGKPAQAAHWARMSILLGHYMGNGEQVPRIGFRHPPALWEGPFDVLRFALRALGDDAGADEAELVYEQAKSARTSQRRNGDEGV
jgi:tetratricopeptide (TPR) repeat protein